VKTEVIDVRAGAYRDVGGGEDGVLV